MSTLFEAAKLVRLFTESKFISTKNVEWSKKYFK